MSQQYLDADLLLDNANEIDIRAKKHKHHTNNDYSFSLLRKHSFFSPYSYNFFQHDQILFSAVINRKYPKQEIIILSEGLPQYKLVPSSKMTRFKMYLIENNEVNSHRKSLCQISISYIKETSQLPRWKKIECVFPIDSDLNAHRRTHKKHHKKTHGTTSQPTENNSNNSMETIENGSSFFEKTNPPILSTVEFLDNPNEISLIGSQSTTENPSSLSFPENDTTLSLSTTQSKTISTTKSSTKHHKKHHKKHHRKIELFSRTPSYNKNGYSLNFHGLTAIPSTKNAILVNKSKDCTSLYIRKVKSDQLEITSFQKFKPIYLFIIGLVSYITPS